MLVWAFAVFAFGSVHASEWPQILGPTRNGITSGEGLAKEWPKEEPKRVWQMQVGQGYAGPAVADGRVVVFHRQGNEEIIECRTVFLGEPVWKHAYRCYYRSQIAPDNGPRAVPAIHAGKVYTLGADGKFHCLKLDNGEVVFQVDLQEKYQAGLGYFGLACSPLIEGDAVILNIGGQPNAGIIALDKNTCEKLWAVTDQEASYSSPVAANISGQRRVLVFAREGLVDLEPKTGKVRSEFHWRASISASVNAANPLVIGDQVFLSASYNTGAVLLNLAGDKPQVVWKGDDSLSSQFATAMYRDGFLYGLHGRHDFSNVEVRCVELATGKVRWSEGGLFPNALILAGEDVLILTERGELIRVPASPEGYEVTARAQILGSSVRALPALAYGHYFARDANRLVCVDLR